MSKVWLSTLTRNLFKMISLIFILFLHTILIERKVNALIFNGLIRVFDFVMLQVAMFFFQNNNNVKTKMLSLTFFFFFEPFDDKRLFLFSLYNIHISNLGFYGIKTDTFIWALIGLLSAHLVYISMNPTRDNFKDKIGEIRIQINVQIKKNRE